LRIVWTAKTWANLHTWKLEARKRRLTFLSSRTWISNVKYFFRFFTITTKNGSFIPSVADGSAGQVMYVDWIFDPTISRTLDCMSSSCGRFTWPLTTAKSVTRMVQFYNIKLEKRGPSCRWQVFQGLKKRTTRTENFIGNIKLEYHIKLIKIHKKITFFRQISYKKVLKEQ
jgi:hypothetical protein